MENNKNMTAVEWLEERLNISFGDEIKPLIGFFVQAKESENERHERFNKFLNDEIKLGMSDKETIERIQWYYNTYFNETYGGNK